MLAIAAAGVAMLLCVAESAQAAQTCSFGAMGGLALAFGRLDPSVSGPPTAYANFVGAGTASGTWGNCSSLMTMTATSAATGSSTSWAMVGPGGVTMAYSVILPAPTRATGTGNGFTAFTLGAQILGTDYVDAVPGSYSDTLTIMVTP